MNTIENAQVTETLRTLHQLADEDRRTYMAVLPDEGRFLYFLAVMAKAKNIVEFGCSMGISTIYLGAAAKDNGGKVTTSELNTDKIDTARGNIERAGVGAQVTILSGNAGCCSGSG